MDHAEKARKIISEHIYITIASVTKEGKPWNTPVFSAYDKNYNFYWGSHRDSRHSKNIQANNNIFLVMYDSTAEAGTGTGVYIEAEAIELEKDEEIEFAHQLLQARRPVPYWKLDEVKGETPICLYRATPKKVWVNSEDEVDGIYVDTRTEVNL